MALKQCANCGHCAPYGSEPYGACAECGSGRVYRVEGEFDGKPTFPHPLDALQSCPECGEYEPWCQCSLA